MAWIGAQIAGLIGLQLEIKIGRPLTGKIGDVLCAADAVGAVAAGAGRFREVLAFGDFDSASHSAGAIHRRLHHRCLRHGGSARTGDRRAGEYGKNNRIA